MELRLLRNPTFTGLLFSFQRPTVPPIAVRPGRPSKVGAASNPLAHSPSSVFLQRSSAADSSEPAGTTRLFAGSGSAGPSTSGPRSDFPAAPFRRGGRGFYFRLTRAVKQFFNRFFGCRLLRAGPRPFRGAATPTFGISSVFPAVPRQRSVRRFTPSFGERQAIDRESLIIATVALIKACGPVINEPLPSRGTAEARGETLRASHRRQGRLSPDGISQRRTRSSQPSSRRRRSRR